MPDSTLIRRSRTSHDIVMQAIGRAIVAGRYPTGSILPSKEDLMAELAVSITTIREALQTLAAKGMVAAKTKVGTRVLDENRWNMFDADILAWRLEAGAASPFMAALFEIRQGLEPIAAALAAVRRTDAEVALLRDLAARLDLASEDRAACVDLDLAFHRCILEAARNPFLHSLGALIGTALTASFTLSAPTRRPELGALARSQHERVVELIDAADPQGASDAMLALIRQAWMNSFGPRMDPIARVEVAAYPTMP